MDELIQKKYEEVKDLTSLTTFTNTVKELEKEYCNMEFMTIDSILDLAVGKFKEEKVEPVSEIREEKTISKLDSLEMGNEMITVVCRVLRVREPKKFTTKQGKKGQFSKISIGDDTLTTDLTLWNTKVRMLKDVSENDVVKITNCDVKTKFRSNDEIELSSSHKTKIIKVSEGDVDYPSNIDEYPTNSIKISPIQDITEAGTYYSTIGLISKIKEPNHFIKQDETDGYVQNITVKDTTGEITLTLWGEDTKKEHNIGDIIKIVNAECQYDDYSSTGFRLNSYYDTDLSILKDDEKYSDLINLREELKPVQLNDIALREHNDEIRVKARVLFSEELKTFTRNDGSMGKLKNYIIADNTGVSNLTCWDKKAEMQLSSDTVLSLENVRVNHNAAEPNSLNCNKSSRINPVLDSDVASFDELINKHYPLIGCVDELEEYTIQRVKGKVIEVNPLRLSYKCPYCNGRLTETPEQYLICEGCGEEINEPKNLISLNINIILDSEEVIQTNLYNEKIAKLTNMSLEELVKICETDTSTIDTKITNTLKDKIITLLGTSYYNNYTDEMSLTTKQIIKVEDTL